VPISNAGPAASSPPSGGADGFLVARGRFSRVFTTPANTTPLAFAIEDRPEGAVGQLWTGTEWRRHGPVLPASPDSSGAEEMWAFGIGPDRWSVQRPVAVRLDRRAPTVFDARTGGITCRVAVPDGHLPQLAAVAAADGVALVVVLSVNGSEAVCTVCDAGTGEVVNRFAVWFPHWVAGDPRILALPPATGAFVGLMTAEERLMRFGDWEAIDRGYVSVLDLVQGTEAGVLEADGAYEAWLGSSTFGAVLVQPTRAGLQLRTFPGGNTRAEIPALDRTSGRRPDIVAVGVAGGQNLVAAAQYGDPTLYICSLDVPSTAECVTAPSPMRDVAFAADGTLLIATDTYLAVRRPSS
jgi:hypothetical protein